MTISKWKFIYESLRELFCEVTETCPFCSYTKKYLDDTCELCYVYKLCREGDSEYRVIVDCFEKALKSIDSLVTKLELLEKRMVRKDEVESD